MSALHEAAASRLKRRIKAAPGWKVPGYTERCRQELVRLVADQLRAEPPAKGRRRAR